MLWNSILSQLENKKFIYGLVREGGRARDHEVALLWLSDCSLVHKVSRITTPKLPLKAKDTFHPVLSIRTSMADYHKEDWLFAVVCC